MIAQLKAGLAILLTSAIIWHLAMPLLRGVVGQARLERRRTVWLALMALAIVSPSFWLWVLFAAPAFVIAFKDDDHPMAVVLAMLHVIPNGSLEVPVVGINALISLSNYRVLALVILLPAAIRLANVRHLRTPQLLRVCDWAIWAYFALQLFQMMPYESSTASARRLVLMLIDVWLVYYVFSRSVQDRRHFQDAMAMLFLGGALAAGSGLVELVMNWNVHEGSVAALGLKGGMPYRLMRGAFMRAPGPLGHPLSLAIYLTFAILALLFLREAMGRETQRRWWAALALLLAGLGATFSRGPVIGLILGVLTFYSIRARKPALPRALLALAVAGSIAIATPLGDSVIGLLSVGGEGELDPSIIYRQQLAQVSWMLIQQRPFFGDPFVMGQMESLRQGEGIIDQVNTYAAMAVNGGLVQVLLWLFVPILGAMAIIRNSRRLDGPDAGRRAFVLACCISLAFTLTVMSFAYVVPFVYWTSAAFAAGLAAQGTMPRPVAVARAARRDVDGTVPAGAAPPSPLASRSVGVNRRSHSTRQPRRT